MHRGGRSASSKSRRRAVTLSPSAKTTPMFPISDSQPTQRAPVVTWMLVVGTAAAFVYQLVLDDARFNELVYLCGIVPARWLDPKWARSMGFPPHDYWPFLTSMFLHGSWLHLIFNMWALAIFGDNVEDRLGHVRFLLLYLLSGLVAGLLHFITNPQSQVPTIGASGAIAGVMGAYFVLYPRARVLTLIPIGCIPIPLQLPAVVYLGLWFVLQFFSATATLVGSTRTSGIAWWAHVGGFLAGIALLRLLVPKRRAVEYSSADS